MKFIVVIPARYASTRLPGKPLAEIAGGKAAQPYLQLCNMVLSHATEDGAAKPVSPAAANSLVGNLKAMLSKPKVAA